MLHLGVITLIPEMFSAIDYGVTGRALKQNLAKLELENPRNWGKGSYRQVDDKPYGGGPGMVMSYEPVAQAIHEAKKRMPPDCQVIYLSPQGKLVDQNRLNQLVKRNQSLLFLAGRYEGLDQRIIDNLVDEEWSLGDFVLSGGELAAMVYIDSLLRLLPGALGHQASAQQDSFMNGLLDYPQYTRPVIVDNRSVPEVLLGGNHLDIQTWRRKQSLGNTWLKRPDLLDRLVLNETDEHLLFEFKCEHGDL